MLGQENRWQGVANREKVRALAETAIRKQQRANLIAEAKEQGVTLSADELSELLEQQMQDPGIQQIMEQMMVNFLHAKLSFHQSETVSHSTNGPHHDGGSVEFRPIK